MRVTHTGHTRESQADGLLDSDSVKKKERKKPLNNVRGHKGIQRVRESCVDPLVHLLGRYTSIGVLDRVLQISESPSLIWGIAEYLNELYATENASTPPFPKSVQAGSADSISSMNRLSD